MKKEQTLFGNNCARSSTSFVERILFDQRDLNFQWSVDRKFAFVINAGCYRLFIF